MLVVCAGMYRACSTWQYDVVADLLEHHRHGQRLGYLSGDQARTLPDAPRRWAVLKSHEGHAAFTRRTDEGRARVVYAYRDIRDVVYSLLHKRAISFRALLRRGMIHQILANHAYWTSRPNVLVQRYESIVREPESAIRELAAFLDLDPPDAEVRELAEAHSLDANRARTQALGRRLQAQGLDLDDPSNAQRYDPHTLLHWNHVRDGRAGTWQSLATLRERRMMARILGPWLVAHQYETDDLWACRGAGQVDVNLFLDIDLQIARQRGAVACGLRVAASRHPNLARAARFLLRLPDPGRNEARPAEPSTDRRLDAAQPPLRGLHPTAALVEQPGYSNPV